MPSKIKWGAYESAPVNALTTELDSKANGTYTAAGPEQNNAGGNQMADFELLVSYAVAPSGERLAALFLVPAIDETNYGDGGGAVAPPATCWRGNFPLRAATGAQRVPLEGVRLPNTKWKAVILNAAGQTTAASSNVLSYRPFNDEAQ